MTVSRLERLSGRIFFNACRAKVRSGFATPTCMLRKSEQRFCDDDMHKNRNLKPGAFAARFRLQPAILEKSAT
jgi:hypothetical protein